MSERFLKRWSRLKGESGTDAPAAAAAPGAPLVAAPAPADTVLPTLADAAKLGADSDYSSFVAPGVDQSVRRLAMKKLFADPHFNIVDGLDIYMGDYNKADPMPAAMLAALHAAKDFLVKDSDPDSDPDSEPDIEPEIKQVVEHDEPTKGPE